MEMIEHKCQKRLTLVGLASLATIPIIGPFGFALSATIFSGKLLRLGLNKQARENYLAERKEIKKKKELETQSSNNFIVPNTRYDFPEDSETAIARRTPFIAKQLLDKIDERRSYEKGLEEGKDIASNYLSRLSQEEYEKIKKIEVIPTKQLKILGLPLGRKSLEVKFYRR